MRPFEYAAGKEGLQGIIMGNFGVGAFLEKHFIKVWLLFCIVTALL
jgi:hypothetical protein